MIERVARAIHARSDHGSTWEELDAYSTMEYLEDAKAAIGAMREPTEAMIEASNREWDGRMSHRSSGAWQAMVDAAFTNGERT